MSAFVKNMSVEQVVRIEYLLATVLVVLFYIVVAKFDWWWLPVTFLLFDLSAVGYALNSKMGAFTYNMGHSLIGPSIAIGLYILTSSALMLFLALVWLFHIFTDRALGYGLKRETGFTHTHLGTIGKNPKR